MTNPYNGWTNWDTWNVNLWLTNEEGLYHTALSTIKFNLPMLREVRLREVAKSAIPESEDIDYSEVNWSEIVEALLEE
jgi:hypothetical protein